MSRIQYSPDFEEAAELSRSRKAVSDPLMISPPERRDVISVQIAFDARSRSFEWVYGSSNAIKVKGLDRPRAGDVDRVNRWRPW